MGLILLLSVFLAEAASQDIGLSLQGREENREETAILREEFLRRIGNTVEVEEDYLNKAFEDALCRLSEAGVEGDQYFLYVDRNPKRQVIFVCFFDAEHQTVIEIGRGRVSTGKPTKGRDYFLTPTGVFRNTVAICGYRALGTKNDQGWRGLGKRGSRVWDFGWQEGYKIINNRKEFIYIRFLMHATDPDYGEARLGKQDSKGCVRISGKLNEFLDHFGIIDRDYERQKHHWLLRKDRKPVFYQGEYLVIGDLSSLE